MDVMIYDNYGVLAHEKQHVYTTAPEATAKVSEPFYIILPDAMQPYETAAGEIALSVPNGFNPYLLRELLSTARDGMPVLRWIDRDGKAHEYLPGTYGVGIEEE